MSTSKVNTANGGDGQVLSVELDSISGNAPADYSLRCTVNEQQQLRFVGELDSDGRRALIVDALKAWAALNSDMRRRYIQSLARGNGGEWACNDFVTLNPQRDDRTVGSYRIDCDTGKSNDLAHKTKSSDIIGTTAIFSSEPNNMAWAALRVLRWIELNRAAPPTQWTYCDANGAPIISVKRYDTPGKAKSYVPQVMGKDRSNKLSENADINNNRPLYHLDAILNSDLPILFCEGEKAADAGAELLQFTVIGTATLSGAQSPNKTDYSPCANRDCLIWRDNDEPGITYQNHLINLLTAAGARSIKVYSPDDWCPIKGDAWDYFVNCWEVDLTRFNEATATNNKSNNESTDSIVIGLFSGKVPKTPKVATSGKVNSNSFLELSGATWGELQTLSAHIPSKAYPIDALPPNLRELTWEINEYNGAPVGLIATCALSALSLAIQSRIDAARDSVLRSPISLFTLTVAEPNERKSAVDSLLMSAIRQFERESIQNGNNDIANYDAAAETFDAKHAALKSAIKKAAVNCDDTSELERQLADLQLNQPIEPAPAKLLYPNATIESLLDGLSRYPSGGVMSAEGGSIFGGQMAKRDNVMMLFSTANQLWSGEFIGAVDRITRQSRRVDNARLTFSLQIQERVLKTFLQSNGELGHGSGFLARFLIAWPDSTQGHRDYSPPPDSWPNLSLFHERIKEILNEPIAINDQGGLLCPSMPFSADGQRLWIDYYNSTEHSLGRGGANENLHGQAGKAAENVARVAAIFEYFTNSYCSEISGDNVNRAIQIVDWHLSEARRLFSPTAGAASQSDAAKLDKWLLAQCSESGTNEVRRNKALQCCLKKTDLLDAAIDELCELNRVKLVKRADTKYLIVNPALLD